MAGAGAPGADAMAMRIEPLALAEASAADEDAMLLRTDDAPEPRDVALVREAWETYGDDIERRLADLEAGRHPYQRPR
jgi:hypothetical protein